MIGTKTVAEIEAAIMISTNTGWSRIISAKQEGRNTGALRPITCDVSNPAGSLSLCPYANATRWGKAATWPDRARSGRSSTMLSIQIICPECPEAFEADPLSPEYRCP